MLAWQKNFESHTPKHPKEVGRAKEKEPSVHQIGCGNKSGIFTRKIKANKNKPERS
jgi:hypothetical protein